VRGGSTAAAVPTAGTEVPRGACGTGNGARNCTQDGRTNVDGVTVALDELQAHLSRDGGTASTASASSGSGVNSESPRTRRDRLQRKRIAELDSMTLEDIACAPDISLAFKRLHSEVETDDELLDERAAALGASPYKRAATGSAAATATATASVSHSSSSSGPNV